MEVEEGPPLGLGPSLPLLLFVGVCLQLNESAKEFVILRCLIADESSLRQQFLLCFRDLLQIGNGNKGWPFKFLKNAQITAPPHCFSPPPPSRCDISILLILGRGGEGAAPKKQEKGASLEIVRKEDSSCIYRNCNFRRFCSFPFGVLLVFNIEIGVS